MIWSLYFLIGAAVGGYTVLDLSRTSWPGFLGALGIFLVVAVSWPVCLLMEWVLGRD